MDLWKSQGTCEIGFPRNLPPFRSDSDYLGMDSEKLHWVHILNQIVHQSVCIQEHINTRPTMSSKIEKTTSSEVKNAIVDVDSQTHDEGEVFQTDVEGQNYRTVSW